MGDVKMCGVCGRNEAINTCEECKIPLCEECTKQVRLVESEPGYQIKGVSLSVLRSGEKILKVCQKCQQEVDFM